MYHRFHKIMNTKPELPLLTDAHGRSIHYLRLSITDRCNLRCFYCNSNAKEEYIPHDSIMRYEEMLRIIDTAVSLGIHKVRLTGGEPFARKNFITFLENIRKQHATIDIRITSNATLIHPYLKQLQDLKVNCINVSLDSFNPQTFAKITGQDQFSTVYSNIEQLLKLQIPIKINAVALRGLNEADLPSFVDFAKQNPVDVRFIEFMPMGSSSCWTENYFWPATDILEKINKITTLTIDNQLDQHHGPARMYNIENGIGRIGFITPLSCHFCYNCNRLRITSSGKLRTCLFDDKEYNLLPIMRHAKLNMSHVKKVIIAANRNKPLGVNILKARGNKPVTQKNMMGIGG